MKPEQIYQSGVHLFSEIISQILINLLKIAKKNIRLKHKIIIKYKFVFRKTPVLNRNIHDSWSLLHIHTKHTKGYEPK